MTKRIIFITGGVVSSLGKGVIASALGKILQFEGYSVRLRKLDPYLNIDPGTMNPNQHGEVFVTADGGETDLDLGYYERFTNNDASKYDSISSGKIYQRLLQEEREGKYAGQTVQIIPHVTNLIKEVAINGADEVDFLICEVGGTVGDIESQPFLEAIRQLKFEMDNVALIHTTLLPYIKASDEIKTKPTQHSVKELMSYGLIPDVLMCRTSMAISESDRKKISSFCNVRLENVIEAPDLKTIYESPIKYAENGLGRAILKHFHLNENANKNGLKEWNEYVISFLCDYDKTIKLCICGKYTDTTDTYKSVIAAIKHSSAYLKVNCDISILDTRGINEQNVKEKISAFDCIIIPGGFGTDGVKGKIEVIRYCRENNIPLLGICYGMQLCVIEFARNVLGIENATSGELMNQEDGISLSSLGGVDLSILQREKNPVKLVDIMQSWKNEAGDIEIRGNNVNLGGTMRLGNYKAIIKNGTLAKEVYKAIEITERHRHRYEIDMLCEDMFKERGGVFSGVSPDGKLPEIFEIKEYIDSNGHKQELKYFISCQFHPEFRSRPINPHPLFIGLLNSVNRN